MDLYPLLVFLHVLGAVGLFAALGVEVLAFQRLRRADAVEQARSWMAVLQHPGGPVGHVSMLTILVTGIWMMIVRWGPEAWMITALVAVAGIIVAAVTLTRPAMAPLSLALAEQRQPGAIAEPPHQHAALAEPPHQHAGGWRGLAERQRLRLGLWLRVAIAVGIIALMTVKPGVAGSLAIMVAALVLGTGMTLVTAPGRASSAVGQAAQGAAHTGRHADAPG